MMPGVTNLPAPSITRHAGRHVDGGADGDDLAVAHQRRCRSGSPGRRRSASSRCGSRTAATPAPCRCSGTDRRSGPTARPCPAPVPSPSRPPCPCESERARRVRRPGRPAMVAGLCAVWAGAAGARHEASSTPASPRKRRSWRSRVPASATRGAGARSGARAPHGASRSALQSRHLEQRSCDEQPGPMTPSSTRCVDRAIQRPTPPSPA